MERTSDSGQLRASESASRGREGTDSREAGPWFRLRRRDERLWSPAVVTSESEPRAQPWWPEGARASRAVCPGLASARCARLTRPLSRRAQTGPQRGPHLLPPLPALPPAPSGEPQSGRQRLWAWDWPAPRATARPVPLGLRLTYCHGQAAAAQAGKGRVTVTANNYAATKLKY